ncbi:MAG: L,D-transpeptidase family protein [Chloroflexota bacterium]
MIDSLLVQAKTLIGQGQKAEARRLLQRALTLDPNSIEAWLLLTAIAAPRASVEYAERALALDPNNATAQAALAWARRRLALQTPTLELPAVPQAFTPAHLRRRSAPVSKSKPSSFTRSVSSSSFPFGLTALTILVALFVSGALMFGGGLFYPPIPRAVAQVGTLAKATFTYTPTDTPTDTQTFTPTFTPTNTPTDTPTFTPTDTPTNTATFTPTDTPLPTSTPLPTNTPLPTWTLAPPTATSKPPVSNGRRWIDVNLTTQSVTAYEGDAPLATFVVSTGTWQHPTVTGKYNIYVKHQAADMRGPGYFLPDVPYVMYFYEGYGLHGTYWHNNFGTPMSHGCVNLTIADAAWLFDFASVGTLVKIHY